MITNQEMQVGLTLELLSQLLNLRVDFLEDLGLRDFRYSLSGSLEVPYLDEDGCLAEAEDDLVTNLDLFYFSGGKRPPLSTSGPRIPYGMWRMDKIHRWGWVLLVKQEVDCWILWNCGIPALGIPDSIDWSGEWRAHLEDLEVYVLDQGIIAEINQCPEALLYLNVMGCIGGYCDILNAHLEGQDLFAIINELRTQAIPFLTYLEGLQPIRSGSCERQ